MMKKYELHAHTSETSFCGKVAAKKVVELYKEKGFSGMFITDHYRANYFESLNIYKHKEFVDRYLKGYKIAKEHGEKIGLKVMLGIEISFKENDNDYLVYGIDEEFLYNNPNVFDLTLEEFFNKYKDDLFICIAHPFRTGRNVMDGKNLHGCEVYNGHPIHNSRNYLAKAYANKNNLIPLYNSDFHQDSHLDSAHMEFFEEIENEKDLVDKLKNKEYRYMINGEERP